MSHLDLELVQLKYEKAHNSEDQSSLQFWEFTSTLQPSSGELWETQDIEKLIGTCVPGSSEAQHKQLLFN